MSPHCHMTRRGKIPTLGTLILIILTLQFSQVCFILFFLLFLLTFIPFHSHPLPSILLILPSSPFSFFFLSSPPPFLPLSSPFLPPSCPSFSALLPLIPLQLNHLKIVADTTFSPSYLQRGSSKTKSISPHGKFHDHNLENKLLHCHYVSNHTKVSSYPTCSSELGSKSVGFDCAVSAAPNIHAL